MKKLSLFLCTTILVFSSIGCKKDFLEKFPPDQLSDGSFYKTQSDAESAINASYNPLQWANIYNLRMWATDIIAANAIVGAGGGSDGIETVQQSEFNTLPNNAGVLDIWNGPGVGIARCNSVLENVPAMSISESSKNNIIGQAKFLRSLYWFIWTRLFGDIPLLTKLPRPGENLDLPRSPQAQVYAAIVADLKDAITLLPVKVVKVGTGRATKGAAQSLLAKVYLELKDYVNAADYANQVIASGTYSLFPNYADNFTVQNNNGGESVFAVQYTSNSGFADWFSEKRHQGAWAGQFMAPRNVKVVPGDGGFGWCQPTSEFVSVYESGDTRKKATVVATGDTINGSSQVATGSLTGYNVIKFLNGANNTIMADGNLDFPVIRFAEVLLIYAEAENKLGNTTNALPYLNMVRTRAGLAPLSGLSQDAFHTALLKERRIEFAFEGVWYFDVLRQGFNYANQYFHDRGKVNFSQKNMLFPVPQQEIGIDVNLGQNPGY